MPMWDAARWRAVSAAVDRMLDLEPAAWEAALTELRARDEVLAADVMRLLAERPAVEAGRFLEGGAAAALPTVTSTSSEGLSAPPRTGPLLPGSEFGGYRLGRVLGRGGMGIVYEAEETNSGRRVALKVLQRRHDDEYDRERFEREGRLAASIDHEHCVYVFAAEEIAGVPAIAMELMHGTLADRLATDGPLSPTAAVDAALQLVAGLQAASAAGILHRDVKPSNCFVDADGIVKIGDFGISRSTRPVDETTRSTRGHIAATPAYASPEQLSGKALDVRADIYSLGTTIYELLTGERPFTRPDLMALLMAVANEPPRPPHAIAPRVPRGLSVIVLRCLAKRPEDRFQTYDALAAALEPYASWSPSPATLAQRVAGTVFDQALLRALLTPVSLAIALQQFAGPDRRLMLAQLAVAAATSVTYFGVCEGRWGSTAGKALAGIMLIETSGAPARMRAAFGRAALFLLPGILPGVVAVLSFPPATASPAALLILMSLSGLAYMLLLGALFATARRRNGYAGLHDLASGTRVVSRAARLARAARPTPRPRDASGDTRLEGDEEWRGGFAVRPGAIEGLAGWHRGVDPRLNRPVWIRDLPPDTAPLTIVRARLVRATRLRWLAGRRAKGESWDVYEAAAGVPLSAALAVKADWATARVWLADLAHELSAQAPGDQPPLAVERVWILDSGRVKLIDDPTRDAPPVDASDRSRFLQEVMVRIRERSNDAWPLSAERLLRTAADVPLRDSVTQLDRLQRTRTKTTRGWRLITQLASVFVALALAIPFSGFLIWFYPGMERRASALPPLGAFCGFILFGMLLLTALIALPLAPVLRGACIRLFGFELVDVDGKLASRWRVLARNLIVWSPILMIAVAAKLTETAEAVDTGLVIVVGGGGWSSRIVHQTDAGYIVMFVGLILFFAGAIWALVDPSRGIQDRLAGTWIVPR